jgi:hypothetical protein
MSEYFYLEQWYRWLRENFKFIVVGILLLLLIVGCCCITGANMTTEGRVGKSSEGAER